jgi:hypothetical protein
MGYQDLIETLTEDDLGLDVTPTESVDPINLDSFPIEVLKVIARKIIKGWADIEIARWANVQLVENPQLASKLGLDVSEFTVKNGRTNATFIKAKAHVKPLRQLVIRRKAQLEENAG